MSLLSKGSLLLGLALVVSTAGAATIYDNSDVVKQRLHPGTLEVGDEINFVGAERILTGFQLEYWGVFTGPVQARVRLYNNTGSLINGYASPSTELFDTEWFNLPFVAASGLENGRGTLIFSAGSDNIPVGLNLPNKVTLSVQFQGMTGTDDVALQCYGPAAIGTSQADYWVFENNVWDLRVDNTGPIDFGLIVTAVPEPTSFALLFGAGIVALAFRRK